MRNAEQVLGVIRQRGIEGKPLEDIYRQLYNPDLYLVAYARLSKNQGALTPGTTAETVDGMTLAKIEQLIADLRCERYRWTPVRRTYIPKANGRKRPLGIPTVPSHCTSMQQDSVFPWGWAGPPDPPSLPRCRQSGELRDQRCCLGLRKSAMMSGVSVIQRGPWGTVWTESRQPDLHQSAMVETLTLSRVAAALAE